MARYATLATTFFMDQNPIDGGIVGISRINGLSLSVNFRTAFKANCTDCAYFVTVLGIADGGLAGIGIEVLKEHW
jgi:hypothetical protein